MMAGVHYCGARGGSIPTFGPDVTRAFCLREGIQLVVRSHQYVSEGVKFMHGGRCVSLFSARNYSEMHDNDAALLLLAADEAGALRVRAKRLARRQQAHGHQPAGGVGGAGGAALNPSQPPPPPPPPQQQQQPPQQQYASMYLT